MVGSHMRLGTKDHLFAHTEGCKCTLPLAPAAEQATKPAAGYPPRHHTGCPCGGHSGTGRMRSQRKKNSAVVLPVAGFCLVSVLPYPGGGGGGGWVGLAEFQGGWVSNPPPPPGWGGTLWGPLGLSSQCHFFLLLQVPCNMFIYGVFTCHCRSRVHAPRP